MHFLVIVFKIDIKKLHLFFSCRANIIVIMVVCGILAISIIVANLTIIIVILRNSRFPTSQLIYKLSLAFADILVGIFVVPSFIITLYLFHVGPYQRKTDIKNSFTDIDGNSNNFSDSFDQNANIYYRPETTQTYRNFFGFMTIFTFTISVYTLMFASYDRFGALSNPLRYNSDKAKNYAKRIIITLWVLSIVFAILPIVIPDIGPYRIVAGGILIAVSDEMGAYILGTAMALSFIVMWIFTIGVQFIVKKQIKSRGDFMSRRQSHDSSTERQLSKILSIMIGVFTACILPAIIFLTIPEFVPSLNAQNIRVLTKKPAAAFLSLELATTMILASNSLWNAFIYSIRNKEFRKDASSLHYAIASQLGLITLKKCVFECVSKTTEGRSNISSAFTTTETGKKNSSTAEGSMSTAQSVKQTTKSSNQIESSM